MLSRIIASKNLKKIIKKLKLETISIAKTDLVNNVSWNNIKTQIQLIFLNTPIKIIICNALIKYPPKDLRPFIIEKMHCLSTRRHRGVTKTYN